MATSHLSEQQISLPLTSGVQAGPAKISVMQTAKEPDYLEHAADSSIRLLNWRKHVSLRGLSWKMSRASSQRTKEPLLRQLSTDSKRSGIWGDGFRLTLPTRACPTTVKEYSLSEVLDRDVPISSLLTAANCLGILRRENRARRRLDKHFVMALSHSIRLWFNVAAASDTPWQRASAPRYAPNLEAIKAVIQTDRYCVARNLTWNECEKLMGFPAGWTVDEGD